MMRAHRLLGTGLVTLGVLVGGLVFTAAPALAAPGFELSSSFGSFVEPLGVAVDESGGPSSGDVYVADYHGGAGGEGLVTKFGATGTELSTIAVKSPYGVAVNQTDGDLYVADLEGGAVDVFGPSGTELASLETPPALTNPYQPAGVAVDPSNGDVYVAELGNNVVDVFSSAGKYVSSFPDSAVAGTVPVAIAIDSDGNVYVANSGSDVVEFSSAGVCVNSCTPINDEGAQSVAVDPATNQVYVDDATSIKVYQQSGGTPITEFGLGVLGESLGLAVEPGVHKIVYLSDDGTKKMDIFVPTQPLSARTEPASEVTKTTAKLHGKVALEGGGTIHYHFDYGKTTAYEIGSTPAAEVTVTSGSDEAEVSAEIKGLEVGATYHYKIVATDSKPEAAEGKDETLGLVAPLIEATSTPYVGVFEARVEAQVNPESLATTCLVEYGETTAYGAHVPCEQASLTGSAVQSASMHLAHLTAGTTYHYRVVAENAIGTSGPSEGTGELTTAAAVAPVFEGESVSGESEAVPGQEEVTFSGQVNPELQLTSACAFEYGKLGDPSYEASVPCEQSSQQIGNGSASVSVEAKVGGLQVGSDYHYRLVVKNETGSAEGPDQVFGPPVVVTGAVLSETPGIAPGTTATVGGEVNPEGFDAHYYVQYGSEGEEYAHSAPFLPLGVPLPQGIDAGSGTAPVVLGGESAPPDVSLEGLAAGGVYHYRLVAYNADGTTYGAAQTVTVLPAPVVGPASVSEITQGSATITTSVNPEGLHTLYELDVGTSTAYGTPYPGDAGSGSGPVLLAFHLSGLHAGDTYHFRLTASNSNGTSTEADQTFTTVPGPQGFVPAFTVTPSLPPLAFTAVAIPAEGGTTGTGPTSNGLTRAQKLKDALKQCKNDKSKSKRTACEKAAKKKYGVAVRKKK
jgi:DNA-binding beta-propeller fold protein YncE